ncbi:MAG: methylaspartate mutase subunit E [Deltaproteobacteria bacterium]|nr:methylaspartate mutase subunit E [Deltaproteobacteria bacterium]
MELKNRRWSDEEFLRERKKVLALWPTGREVDLEEAAAYLKKIPLHKNYALTVVKAKEEGRTLVQPRGGVALVENHIELLQCLESEGGADLLPNTTDTYTRNLRFQEAERGIAESRRAGRSMLNGFPLVNHGLAAARRVSESVHRPIIVLSGTAFPQLVAEMGFAGGLTAFLGAAISYTASYTKDLPFEEGIKNYQYVDRLTSFYREKGIRLHREQPGFLTGTLIPPGIGIAVAVLEMLMAAGQGVKHYSMGLCQSLNIIQDVAGLWALEEAGKKYLTLLGYNDVFFSIATHQWMQAFPSDEPRAYAVIVLGGIIAALAGATQIITKSTHEAEGIPTKEANAMGIKATRMAIRLTRSRLPASPEVLEEKRIILKEASAIIDKTLEMGEGDPVAGALRSLQAGVLDIPWAPNRSPSCQLTPRRGSLGVPPAKDPGTGKKGRATRGYRSGDTGCYRGEQNAGGRCFFINRNPSVRERREKWRISLMIIFKKRLNACKRTAWRLSITPRPAKRKRKS